MLQILIEAPQAPDRQSSLSFVTKGLTGLGFSKIAKIYGRQAGEELPAWVQEVDLSQAQRLDKVSQTDEQIHCPKCHSTQILADKGFSLGKAAIGAVLLGPIGLTGGFLGSNRVFLTCLKCGHKWKAGQVTESMVEQARPTKAKVNRSTFPQRLGAGIFCALFLGLISATFLGHLAWAVAFIVLLGFLTVVDGFTASLNGDCPYCRQLIVTDLQKKKLNCKHCRGDIQITRLTSQEYEFSPSSQA